MCKFFSHSSVSNDKISLFLAFNGFKDSSHKSLIKSKSLETTINYLEANDNREVHKQSQQECKM